MADQVFTRETISVTTQNVTEGDKALGAEFNHLAWRALAAAGRYLDYGPDEMRLAVVKSFLGPISKLSVLESKTEIEASRSSLLDVMSAMTKVTEARPLVTPQDIIDSVTHDSLPQALVRRPHHQDDESPAPEA